LGYYVAEALMNNPSLFSRNIQNVAAVTSTSTRAPIYKAYARGENIGDVTAKGESVANIADLVTITLLCLCLYSYNWAHT
jgi:hypothetical protein